MRGPAGRPRAKRGRSLAFNAWFLLQQPCVISEQLNPEWVEQQQSFEYELEELEAERQMALLNRRERVFLSVPDKQRESYAAKKCCCWIVNEATSFFSRSFFIRKQQSSFFQSIFSSITAVHNWRWYIRSKPKIRLTVVIIWYRAEKSLAGVFWQWKSALILFGIQQRQRAPAQPKMAFRWLHQKLPLVYLS